MLPAKDEQAFITGKKKSGKSTLVRQLITKLGDNEIIIVIDSKHEWTIKPFMRLGNKRVRNLRLPNIRMVTSPGIYVYKSKYPHFYDTNVSKILISAYNRKNCTVVIHEIYHFCHGANPLPALGQAIVQGRAKNLRLFMESQRPMNIPGIAISEANIWICFKLQKPGDRLRVADDSGFPEMATPVRASHDFWVARDTWDNAVYIENTKEDDTEWDVLKKRPQDDKVS
jgi:hypothetical protein